MQPQWHFNRRLPRDRMRDSANDAFFTAESLDNLSEALVRESIQNSLDAADRSDGLRQVRVRIDFVRRSSPAVRQFLLNQFATARRNFERGLNLPDLPSLFGEDCGHMVIEDFGTKGLTGDIDECRLDRAANNAFFSFFRAEGRSFKEGESLGRWGIGKQVFPTASQLHAMLGLSVRRDSPERILMGSAVVKTHTVGDDDYQPDGWFGLRDSDEEPVKAVTSAEEIDSFAGMFGLKRGNHPGLSVIIPAVDERVSTVDLRRGVVRSFFWPILTGELVVDLESPGEEDVRIDADSLITHKTVLVTSETPGIDLAVWASTVKPADTVKLPEEAAVKPVWKDTIDQLLPESKMAEIRTRLDADQRVAIKVPVRVRPKILGREERMSYFTVFIALSRESGLRPLFLRDGIAVSDVRCASMTGCRALVAVEDAPLAGLLGDAEGVNHTQWQKDSSKFHNRYYYGEQTIRFVTRSVYEIMQRLHAAETKGDPSLLLDLFFLSSDDGETELTHRLQREKGAEGGKPPFVPPPRKPRRYTLEPTRGGFTLKPGTAEISKLPLRLRIRAGYAVRRGDAIRRWTADDFVFIGSPLKQEQARNVIVSKYEGNSMEVEIRKPDFLFGVTGFDTKRDLVVKVAELRTEYETNV